MANPYRELFDVPGVRLFVPAALVGRMPMSMIGIGIVLLVSAVTGSYGIAGSVSATCAVAFAVTTPFVGRLADRLGQQRVLLPLLSLHALSMAALVGCVWMDLPSWTFFPAAAAVGASSPSLGAMVRARWSYVLRTDDSVTAGGDTEPAGSTRERTDATTRLQVAYSLESVLDETVFVTGPVIVTMLVTLVDPLAGVAAAGTFAVGGGLALAAQRGSQPPPRPRRPSGTSGVIMTAGMPMVTTAFLLLGAVFGAVDVSVIAFAKEQGHQALAGVVLGTYALGSGVAGLWYGGRRWAASLDRRFAIGLLLTTAGLVPLSWMPGLPSLMVVIFFAGMGISPTIIAGYGLVERLVPNHQLTEGLTWVSTAVGTGVAVGAAAAGRLADVEEARAGLVFALAACLAATAVGIAAIPRTRRRERELQQKIELG